MRPDRPHSRTLIASSLGFLLATGSIRAQVPSPTPTAAVKAPAPPSRAVDAEPAPPTALASPPVEPLPLEPIPDNPPPHEGAIVALSYRIAPPDILLIELLEGLPGRPISGEHLVRPDGKVSLGFYGELELAGLTTVQAKVKLIEHLRKTITDEALGLIVAQYEVREVPMDEALPAPPDTLKEAPVKPPSPGRPSASRSDSSGTRDLRSLSFRFGRNRLAAYQRPEPTKEAAKPETDSPQVDGPVARIVAIPPEESNRVHVDVASYNSKVYYVQGDVGSPGRLPITGAETVLDGIQYAGGLTGSADPKRITLYRPARAGKPAREYPIDYEAIRKGKVEANLQLFPGDRLFVGRRESYIISIPPQ